ncbi:MAG TPA: LysR substrate-binding domain-containing protein [Geminicoccaceae bacterium]|nr:LysR substrate-binding domain-containing protein [Geminicoccus sp.]HMU51955.1 LysR substrate-binding domain-containing protein [Geminicoccaceae bacterium]
MRLPPLNALRVFEAAARHESFARAAQELHVSQGAVSRHVKLLEARLGVALFRRHPQGIELTAPGRALLPELTAALERIARAVARATRAEREIRVIAAPTFAMRWLVPRLPRFRDRHPELRVSVGIFRDSFEDMREGAYDIGINALEGEFAPPPDVERTRLRREVLTPICAPGLLHQPDQPLRVPADLARHTLLHPTADRADWRQWARAAGLAGLDVDGGLVFATMEMALGAAIGGLGVTIGDLDLVRDELAAGSVAAPFGHILSEGPGYFLLLEPGHRQDPRVRAFCDWALAESAADGERSAPWLSP